MVSGPVQLDVSTRASASRSLELRDIFETVDESKCPSDYNFHMHTVHSDGQLSPETLIEQAIHLGLKEFAITDHHTVQGYRQAQQCLEDWQWRHPAPVASRRRQGKSHCLPRLWTGVEITALLADVDVHILGYAFEPDHEAIQSYLQGSSPRGQKQLAETVIHAIQKAGGLAVLAHPCRYRQPAEVLVPAAVEQGIDGIETYYAYDNPADWRPCPKRTPSMQRLADEFGIVSTCGTDTHGKTLTRRI
ncbi:MAG: PHP domain-containing protein [Leptolyngbya sp. SIO1E4]|nr:PHP domain-containing protein [Leptolyngbya sp. SIO1E4]